MYKEHENEDSCHRKKIYIKSLKKMKYNSDPLDRCLLGKMGGVWKTID